MRGRTPGGSATGAWILRRAAPVVLVLLLGCGAGEDGGSRTPAETRSDPPATSGKAPAAARTGAEPPDTASPGSARPGGADPAGARGSGTAGAGGDTAASPSAADDAGARADRGPEGGTQGGRRDAVGVEAPADTVPSAGVDAPADSVPSAGEDAPGAEEILRRARAAYGSLRTLRAEFHQVLEMRVFEPPRRREGRGTWYQKKPALFRMDFSDPETDVIVADGKHLWLYYPSTHPDQVIRSNLQAPGRGSAMVDLQGRIFRLARTAYDAEYRGRERVGGEPTHLIVLTPRREDTSYREVRVWVDAESHLVRRLEFHDRSETVRTITLDALEPGVTLPDSLFRFEPPPDVEIFRG